MAIDWDRAARAYEWQVPLERAPLRKLLDMLDIGSDERVVLVITGDGLKTLDAVRGSFETYEIEPRVSDFEAVVEGSQVAA